MGVRKDLTGMKFGILTVISKAKSRVSPCGGTIGYWNVRCDCGLEKEVCAQKVQISKAISCGGNCKFGWNAYKEVECTICGVAYNIKNGSLVKKINSNRVCKVCSALIASKAATGKPAANRLSNGEAAFNALYGSYKKSATHYRKVSFELSKEVFKEMTQGNCFYCGSEPRSIRKELVSGNFIYNGIDRVDSNLGYTIENVVSCCSICNFMKRDLQVKEFINHIKKIYEHT
jgi:hypothetical protein